MKTLNMHPTIPVIVFAYRRPDTLAQLLRCLQDEHVKHLYIFCDGDSEGRFSHAVNEVRLLARSVDWCQCEVSESSQNLGLGRSVISGADRVFQRHNAAIFFEDDLICVPGTIAYLESALRHYADNPLVMSVTGWTHPLLVPPNQANRPYFDGKAECWSWGTWARSWKGMDKSAISKMELCRDLGLDIERYGDDLPKMAAESASKNLWAVRWFYHHMLQNGLCLRPPWSMVEHTCWDKSRSTTVSEDMVKWRNPVLKTAPPIPSIWPEPFENLACPALWREAVR